MLSFSWLRVSDVSRKQIQKWWEQIPAEKQKKLSTLPEQSLLERICSDALARQMISDCSGIPAGEITFFVNENGKPFCNQTSLYFNVSHSSGLVCCGISETPIGVDVEKIRRVSPKLTDMLNADELAYVKSFSDENEADRAFLNLWTMREAVIKCKGGTAFQARSVALKIEDGMPVYPNPDYRCGFLDLPEGFCGAYCEKSENK